MLAHTESVPVVAPGGPDVDALVAYIGSTPYGGLVTRADEYQVLGIEEPTATTPFEKAQQLVLAHLDAMTEARRRALEEHKRMLRKAVGHGHVVVRSEEQTTEAMKTLDARLRSVLATATAELRGVRTEQLGHAERTENAKALVRLDGLRIAMRKR